MSPSKIKHKNHRPFKVSEEGGQTYPYCRCCAGTYLRKGLKWTTNFLTEYSNIEVPTRCKCYRVYFI
jgi:hypothetical protein